MVAIHTITAAEAEPKHSPLATAGSDRPERVMRGGKPEMGRKHPMQVEEQQQAPAPEVEEQEQSSAQEQGEKPGEREDGFKSEESKERVLADLVKVRDELKRYKEAEEQREREKLSDIERAQAERDDFRTKWEQAEQARLRSDIARMKGVDPELLTGATEEEMTAHAERLLAWRGDKPVVTNPNPAQGAGNPLAVSDADKTFYEATGRKAPTL